MQIFRNSGAEAHALLPIEVIELHFVDSLDFVDHPLLRPSFLQHLDKVEDIAEDLSILLDSLVCQSDADLQFGVAVVVVGARRRQGSG